MNTSNDKLFINHFCIQRGMYFNTCKILYYGSFYFSDFIRDNNWNYFVPKNNDAYNLKKDDIIRVFKNIDREPCFLIPSFLENKNLIEKSLMNDNYIPIFSEDWLIYNNQKLNLELKDITYIEVKNEEDFELFKYTFKLVYNSGTSSIQPYGDLEEGYLTSLNYSFRNKEIFKHFIAFDKGLPIAICSLCMGNGIGAIYNLAFIKEYRDNKQAMAVINLAINSFINNNGKELFIQMASNTQMVEWLLKNNFNKEFTAVAYCQKP